MEAVYEGGISSSQRNITRTLIENVGSYALIALGRVIYHYH